MGLPEEKPSSTAGPNASAVELPLPEKKKRSWFARMFSTDTRFGRFTRALVRGLALVIGLFALGALAVELLRVQPLQRQYQALQASATQTASDLQAIQAQLEKANQGLASSRGQTVDMQSSLEVEQARVQVLRIMIQLGETRLAVLNKDIPGAKKSLGKAEEYLKSILPQIEKTDADQADTLRALFTLTKNDIDRDQKLFTQDVIRLESELELVEKSLIR